ncbi:MAG: hypothetical protein J6K83_06125 [Bacteroidaceae bacterium]|nr:hypothetical protein [Bacteroidaceae bacterium]
MDKSIWYTPLEDNPPNDLLTPVQTGVLLYEWIFRTPKGVTLPIVATDCTPMWMQR